MELRANRRRKASAFVDANWDYLWDCFFNHVLNYGYETVFLPNHQISLWDKWQSGEKLKAALNRFFLAAGFN
jgi:hypothetical protein